MAAWLHGQVRIARAQRAPVSDEPSWLPAARLGERWALEAMYEEHRERIRRLCQRLLPRPEDAEDAMQAAFVRAFRSVARFRGDCPVGAWIYRIATNQCLEAMRSRRDDVPIDEERVDAVDATGDALRRVAVQAALRQLCPSHRAVLVLRYWEDLSYRDIAAALGLPVTLVKMRLSRAKRAFRSRYEADT